MSGCFQILVCFKYMFFGLFKLEYKLKANASYKKYFSFKSKKKCLKSV